MDASAARRIAAACVHDGVESVFEVGAGTGALTSALLACGARVTTIEIDPDMNAILRDRSDLAAARIVECDAMEFDFDALTPPRWCAAGNLPYNVATGLVIRWIGLRNPPQRIVAMVQRDVAERFAAKPATAAYGSLSILVQFKYAVTRAFVLGPGVFYPRPNVESAVVRLERRDAPAVTVRDEPFFLQVVRAGFAYRRKTLANSLGLALGIERSRTVAALAHANIDTEIRAEHLDLAAFGAIADDLAP